MKKTYIIGIVLIALFMGVILSLVFSTDQYKTFVEAENSTAKKVTVIGELYEDDSHPIVAMHDSFTFYMVDKNGDKRKVLVGEPKPADFERSESVTVTGSMDGDVFIATHVLMKCPSKYEENQEIGVK